MHLFALALLCAVFGLAILIAPLNVPRKEPSDTARVIALIVNALCLTSAIYLYTH